MAKDRKKQPDRNGAPSGYGSYGRGAAPTNSAGRPTGSYGSYATSSYGSPYGGYGAYGTNPAANNTAAPNKNATANSVAPKGAKVEKVDLPDKEKRSRKQKKLAKKSAKFDETDLRNYPMTVGGWIGTFILLAIPLIGGICAICWFFGVGNRSRTAWVRSYVVICLLIVLVLGILLGVGYSVLAKNAKNEGLEGFNGTIYYAASKVIDMLEEPLGGPEATAEIKAMLAEKLGLKTGTEGSDNGGSNGSENEIDNGGQDEGGYVDNGGQEGELDQQVA